MQLRSKKIALYGMCIALAFILSYIEAVLPINNGMPGMKLGLTNLVVLIALYYMDGKSAFIINLVRIALVGLTFGNGISFCYSLAGGALSFLVMFVLKKTGWLKMVAVSVAGSVFHNIGQIVVAMVLLRTTAVVWYFGVLCISGVAAGIVVGLLAGLVLEKLPKRYVTILTM